MYTGATDSVSEMTWFWGVDNSTINTHYNNWGTAPTYDVTKNCAEKTKTGLNDTRYNTNN